MDSEVGSMYLVKFEDGVEIEVWPEEIYDHTDNTVYDMKKLKTASKNQFNKSDRMFNYCWYIFWRDCDPPSCIEDVMEALNNIATKQVNDPNSSFYIYGE